MSQTVQYYIMLVHNKDLSDTQLITHSPYGSEAHRRLFVGRIKHFTRRHKYIQIVFSKMEDEQKHNVNLHFEFGDKLIE